MPAIRERNNLGDLLKYEEDNLYSREQATVATGQHLLSGSIVGRERCTGELKLLDPAATDGTELATGVLAMDVDASLTTRTDALLIARHAILASHALVWPTEITPAEKAIAIDQLAGHGILVRTSA